MDTRWFSGAIEMTSYLKLAEFLLPETEFPVRSYPVSMDLLLPKYEDIRNDFMLPRFHYATSEEEEAIHAETWKSSVDYNQPDFPYGFYFIDVPIGCLRTHFSLWFNNKQVDELVKPYYLEEDGSCILSKQILTIAVFSILHEYGHYLDYKKFDSKVEFAKWIYESKQPFREYDESILKLKERNQLTEDYYNKRWLVYRQCQDERSADVYAINNLQENVSKAINHIFR